MTQDKAGEGDAPSLCLPPILPSVTPGPDR